MIGVHLSPDERSMFKRLRLWRENRRLARLEIAESLWQEAVGDWPLASRYGKSERRRLRELALRFLLRKHLVPGGGDFFIPLPLRLRVAFMAAVPVLELGMDWYDGWYTVVLYEDAFVPDRDERDEFGIVHADRHALSGEAWLQGPVILSIADLLHPGHGHNVVLHELAHKLDMLVEGANGFPPLHQGMSPKTWHDTFTAAWQDMERLDRHGHVTPLDPYALTNPAEFFAVATESFFEAPHRIAQAWPAVYDQLRAFYRQDPLRQDEVRAMNSGNGSATPAGTGE